MLGSVFRKLPVAPCIIAFLLAMLVVAAPIVNAKGRPPRAVFLILPEAVQAPTVDIKVQALGDGRFALTLETTAFEFSDICVADAEPVPVGHAHVHVDGVKVASAFLPIVEIGPLAPGQHDISVVLRGQDHRAIIASDGLVQTRVQVTVPSHAT